MEKINRPEHLSNGFWLGVDTKGQRWLTKLRGSRYAYREITFGKLAQAMGWSCQSSTYIKLDSGSAKVLGGKTGDVHAVHWYMNEHVSKSCSQLCGAHQLFNNKNINSVLELESIKISHILDWPKSEFAAYLFGANEPSGGFLTTNHEFVIIDNEQMFSGAPVSFESARLLNNHDDIGTRRGLVIAAETCNEVGSINVDVLSRALVVPQGVTIDYQFKIESVIKQAIIFARAFVVT